MVREKRGRQGKMQSVKYESIQQRTKNHHKFKKLPSEIVNPNIKLLHMYGVNLKAQVKSHKTQVQSI